MNYYFKNIIIIIFIINLDLYSKSDFIAIKLPDKFSKEIKTILNSRFKVNKNFFIILKNIGNINSYEREVIIKKLNKISEHICSYNLAKSLKKSKLKIENNYLKLIIKNDNWLRNLAIKLDSALRDMAQEGKIVSVKSAIAKEFYINLAKLDYSNINIKEIDEKIKDKLSKNILVNKINLYRLNINKNPKILNKRSFKLPL